jgi:porin
VFPNTSLALRVEYKPDPAVVLRVAALDGVPINRPDGSRAAFKSGDGALLVSEMAFLGRPNAAANRTTPRDRIGRSSMLPPYDDKLAVGLWHYTAAHDDLVDVDRDGQPIRRRGSSGAYLVADRLLFQDATDPDKRTSAFVQFGVGDGRVDRFGSYLGLGIVRSGIFGRPTSDEIGIALAMARNGSHYMDLQRQQAIPVQRSETAVELTYLTQVTPWLALQPDLQYVIHPNTEPALRNAVVISLRFEVAVGK